MQIQPFPQEKVGSFIGDYDEVMTTISVYCHCRLPESYDNMICCDLCDDWFHYRCELLSTDVHERDWYCKLCTRRPSKVPRLE